METHQTLTERERERERARERERERRINHRDATSASDTQPVPPLPHPPSGGQFYSLPLVLFFYSGCFCIQCDVSKNTKTKLWWNLLFPVWSGTPPLIDLDFTTRLCSQPALLQQEQIHMVLNTPFTAPGCRLCCWEGRAERMRSAHGNARVLQQ